jgi:hypothetical protein
MTLKIFISSVFRELKSERKALEAEIHKLQDLFVGMEYFGSDPRTPAEYCAKMVQESNLFVGLFGGDYGSVDENSQKSFTQIEYDTAKDERIPCLIYIKSNIAGEKESNQRIKDPRFHALIERLHKEQIVHTFKDINDLKLQFLIDFIKMLRGPLFDKAIPQPQGPISIDALHSLTKALIKEQIKVVGQDKYIPELYTNRESEEKINTFIQFEGTFIKRAGQMLDQLAHISQVYGLEIAASLLASDVKSRISNAKSPEEVSLITDELKRAFHFNEVEATLSLIISSIRESSAPKYDSFLREIKIKLDGFAFIDKAASKNIAETLFELRRRASLLRGDPFNSDMYKSVLQIFPSERISTKKETKVLLANDLLKELDRLINLNTKRCLALVDKAGTGKTNTICHLAEQIAKDHPVILLSGQMEISTEYDIEFHIQRRLEAEFRAVFSDWMNRVSPGLEAGHKWLFILVDGINESSNLQLFIRLLKNFLPKIENKRIRLILSCRDLFWDLFFPHLNSYLFDGNAVSLNEFTEPEWHQAVQLYFRRFDIECLIDEKARLALMNPLLLRFFCEAYRGKHLGEISNIRLLSIFDLYIKRISENISERLGLLKPDAIEHFLLQAAHEMWETKLTTAHFSSLGVTPQDSSEVASIYNLIRSENVILEESFHLYSKQKAVRFVYDEFMEYMIARSWVDEIYSSKGFETVLDSLLQEAVDAISVFQPAFGAILFLDKMLDRKGRLVNKAITHLMLTEKSFVESRQIPIAYAFENIAVEDIEDDLILALKKFESIARNEIKERLAPVILKILKARPDHPIMKALVNKILEIGCYESPNVSGAKQETPESPAADGPTGSRLLEIKDKLKSMVENVPLLPPGRHHYTEETKLNAISILVGSKNIADYEIVEKGIRNLGQMDLHSALQALESLDLAADEFVYKNISEYLKRRLPEYHIFCAWLLRERYGKEPSQFLIQFLMSEETRVHQYTFKLFEKRFIEAELLDQILSEIQQRESVSNTHQGNIITSWHLANLVRLLGKRSQFRSPDLAGRYGRNIFTTLEGLFDHTQASLRLEIYRAILHYSEFADVLSLLAKLQYDEDVYIRAFARDAISKL